MPTMPDSIGFLGAGKMASAIANGLNRENCASKILAFDPNQTSRERFLNRIPTARFVADASILADEVQMLVLAVKPQMAQEALRGIRLANKNSFVVSVMAGIKIRTLVAWLGTSQIVRAMPNTPCLIGSGAIAMASSDTVTPSERNWVKQLLASMGLVVEIEESQMDAVTGLSGSGPAFVFSFLRAMIKGGVAAGLSQSHARQLAIQTVIGACQLLAHEGLEPQELIDQVTSPGGTTLSGLEVLRAHEFEETVVKCILSASARAAELSELG